MNVLIVGHERTDKYLVLAHDHTDKCLEVGHWRTEKYLVVGRWRTYKYLVVGQQLLVRSLEAIYRYGSVHLQHKKASDNPIFIYIFTNIKIDIKNPESLN